jgi:hypothetical protein
MNSEPEIPQELEPSQLDQAVGGATIDPAHNTGALRNVAGNNTWSGAITLSSSTTVGD